MTGLSLERQDVERLLSEPSSENRAVAAQKVAQSFNMGVLDAQERELATDIFRLLLKDAAVRVRKALADSLAENPDIPNDVAMSLARDVDAIALPVLESSLALSDADLLALLAEGPADRQEAIAGRPTLSDTVTAAVAETGNAAAVARMIDNDGADISENTFDRVMRRYADSDTVTGTLALRGDLPLGIAERLVSLVSDQLKAQLEGRFDMGGLNAEAVMQESRERATVSLLEGGKDTRSVVELVDQIHAGGRLTPTLLIRSLCMGDATFFETGLAKLVNIPVANAYRLVRDKGDLGLKKLFHAAGMPLEFIPIARAAMEVLDETVQTAGDNRQNFRNIMIERVLTRVPEDMDAENLAYLVGKMAPAETAA